MRETIIVGYDDKEPARRALDRAIDEAKKRRARLAVIAVEELPLDPTGPRNFGTLDDGPGSFRVAETPELDHILADARDRVEAQQVHADYLWTAGDPARAIVDLARDRGASLIVVGEHHQGLLGHFLGRSVPEQVEHDAACDVIVVP